MRRAMSSRRPGFTLAEVLTTVVVLAVIAAVVIPTIQSQISRADPQRVGQDVTAVRSAAHQFLTDVRRYPARFAHLTSIISTSTTDTALVDGRYWTSDVARWKGPYLSKDSTAGRATGWGLSFEPGFQNLQLGLTGLSGSGSDPRYLVFRLATDSVQALAVDQMFDDGNLSTGWIRWTVGTAGSTDTLKFLMMPIQ